MPTVLNIIAILFFITALVLFGIRIVRAYKRDGMKGGVIAKGNWRLWIAGVVALFIGLGLHAIATAYTPPDSVALAQRQAFLQALSSSVDVPTSTAQTTTTDNDPSPKNGLASGSSVQSDAPLPAPSTAELEAPADGRALSAAGASTAATRAGNPSPSQIIIFQFDGTNGAEPAYCADEGEDGVMCRSDSLTEIGRGTYKDYMIPGTKTCIAGTRGCLLPRYFDAAHIKG